MPRSVLVSLLAFALLVATAAPALAQAGPGDPSTPGVKNGQILFTSGGKGLFSVQPDGSGLKRIYKRRVWNLDVDRRGRRIAYAFRSLYTMDMRGRGVRDVLRRYQHERRLDGAYSPTWSPNGKRIAFVGYRSGRLYTIGANGRGLKLVFRRSRTIGTFANPRWSPSGEIYFLDDRSSIKAFDLRTRQERYVYRSYDPATGESAEARTPEHFDISRDGSRIVFYGGYKNWTINSDGTGLKRLSHGYSSYESPSFAPDGTEFAAMTDAKIWALDSNEGDLREPRLLTSGSPLAFVPEWAPAPN